MSGVHLSASERIEQSRAGVPTMDATDKMQGVVVGVLRLEPFGGWRGTGVVESVRDVRDQ
jgi:hypothetical protein